MPGQPAVTRRVHAPVSAPSAGGVPSSRWGASGRVASASHSWTAGQARHRPAGEGPMARREARGAGIRRRHGSVDQPVARRAWSMRWGALDPGSRLPKPAARYVPRHEGRIPRFPERRATRRRGPARRAFPRRGRGCGALGCGRPGHTRSFKA
jgi:hypothetical protein